MDGFYLYFTTQGMGLSARMGWCSTQILSIREASTMIALSIRNWRQYLIILVKVWIYLIALLFWTAAIQVIQPGKTMSRPDVPKYSLLWEKTNAPFQKVLIAQEKLRREPLQPSSQHWSPHGGGKGTSPLVFLMLLKSWERIQIKLACRSSRCCLDPRPQSAFPSHHPPL